MECDARDATIIVPQYNRAELTVECVRTLLAVEPTAPSVIVVDDGSETEAAERVEDAFDSVTVLRRAHRGVTAAWNAGARAAATEIVMFLNNDTRSVGAWVSGCIAPLADPDVLMTGAAARRESALPAQVARRLATIRFLEGWCFAVRREDFAAVGGFDESLRLYFSDTDFQLRLLREGGHGEEPLRVVEELAVRHAGHRTTRGVPERRAMWRRDRERFVEKWGGECAAM